MKPILNLLYYLILETNFLRAIREKIEQYSGVYFTGKWSA